MYTPRPGDYGIVRTGTLLGRFIRVFTKSRFNHSFIVIDDKGTIVESTREGAVITPEGVQKYPDARYNRLDQLTDADRLRIIVQAQRLVGTPYGFLDIFVLGLRQFGVNWEIINRKVSKSNKLICSQLVDLAYRRAGVKLFPEYRLPRDVTPGDLAERLIDLQGGVI